MKTCIQTLGILAIAASLSYGQDDAKPKREGKRPAPEAAFKKLDSDNNGSVSLEEFKDSPRGKKNPDKVDAAFKKIDKDSNGEISLEEFKAQSGQRKGGKKKGGKNAEE